MQPVAAQGRTVEPSAAEKEPEKELEAAQEEKIFKRDGALMADAKSPRRRRMGGDINPVTIPNPWILVPDTYQVGSRPFHLFLLGYIKLDGLHDFQANGLGPGFPTHFLSSQIPPRGSPAAAKKGRSGFTVNSSRLQIAGSTPTDLGKVQILFDFNFDANLSGRPAFLVRQFYLDVGQLRFGKAWTTFINVDAIPETLDYEGANSLPEVRQGLIRWTQPLGIGRLASIPLVKDLSLVFAAEQADSQLTLAPGIQPRNRFPDFMMNLEWQRGNSSVWLAGLYRRLEASGRNLEVAGNAWGIQLTGNLEFDPAPYFQFGFIYGVGVSSYVQDTSYLRSRRHGDCVRPTKTLPHHGGVGGSAALVAKAICARRFPTGTFGSPTTHYRRPPAIPMASTRHRTTSRRTSSTRRLHRSISGSSTSSGTGSTMTGRAVTTTASR